MCKLSPDLFHPSPGPKRTRNVPNEARKGALTSPLLSDAPRRSDCLLFAEERLLRPADAPLDVRPEHSAFPPWRGRAE